MKTLRESGFPHNTDYAKFPSGAIKNETETENGTPVSFEVYNDLLVSMYAFILDRGIVINELDDNQTNGYQILEAFKLLTNDLNDKEQVLTLDGTTWSLPIKLSLVPDKYFIYARASENYDSSENYTIKGSEVDTFPFESSQGFSTGDTILIVLERAGVRAYNLSQVLESGVAKIKYIYPSIGNPISYSDSSEDIFYFEDGKLILETLESFDFEESIRALKVNNDIYVCDILYIKGKFLVLAMDEVLNKYSFYSYSQSDLSSPTEMTLTGFTINDVGDVDYGMHIYYRGDNSLLISNSGNTAAEDYDMYEVTLDMDGNEMTFNSLISLDSSFSNTTNSVASSLGLFTLLGGEIKKYFYLNDETEIISNSPIPYGKIFRFNGGFSYYSNGEVANLISI